MTHMFADLEIKTAPEMLEEIKRLHKGIQDYLDGNYGRNLGKIDQCSHGFYGYQGCVACVDEHFTKILEGE